MKINFMSNEVDVKIALLGPPGSGKRTIMQLVLPLAEPRGKPHWPDNIHRAIMAGALFLDFVPANLLVRGRKVRIHLRTTIEPDGPEALAYALDAADAVVFVADSQTSKREANLASLRRIERRPEIFVINKRDLADITSVADLTADLDAGAAQIFEGIATQNMGVFPAIKAAVKLAIQPNTSV